MNPELQFAFSLLFFPVLQWGLPCPSWYLCLELLLFLGGELSAAVRWHFHLHYDSLNLVPHAVTLLSGEKML